MDLPRHARPARANGATPVFFHNTPVARGVLLETVRFVDGQSFIPITLHETDAASDWLIIKRHCTRLSHDNDQFLHQVRDQLRLCCPA